MSRTSHNVSGDPGILSRHPSSPSGLVFDIKRYAIHDGPGIRLTVFFKGCPLNCWWCHNPEGITPEVQRVEKDAEYADSGFDLIGEVKTVNQIMDEIYREVLFFDESGGGVTFSGGEPLMQPEFLSALLDQCRSRAIHTALDTCGYAPEAVFKSICQQVDLFLYDLKFIDPVLHRKYTGVDNQLILDNLKTLGRLARPVIVRFPVIPGINSSEANVEEISAFLSDLENVNAIDLLPFHRFAERKYCRLKIPNRIKNRLFPSEKEFSPGSSDSDRKILESIRKNLESRGFTVRIGG